MDKKEFGAILISILTFTIILSFSELLKNNLNIVGPALIASSLVIIISVAAKKLTARTYNARVEHELWLWERYSLRPGYHLPRAIPLGVIASIAISIFSYGLIKTPFFLSYDTTAHKGSSRKIAGYSFTEMTDWHTAIIGGAGIASTLLLAFICYWFPPLQLIAQAAAFYSFFNLIPFSKLDGGQIFFGSRVLWTSLALISALILLAALLI